MSENKGLSNEELLARQQEQFENYKKEQASKTKKRWLWGCGGCLGAFIILAILFSACTGAVVNEVNNGGSDSEDSVDKNATREQKSALNKAKTYSSVMHMSKDGIYNQLVSEADGFKEADAKYAVDNLKADYKKNALEKAKDYANTQNMSNDAIYNQLTSSIEGFTEEQARYAVDNLEK
ncbi:Ltp family lipoprotein [Staphylococcus agnetis]|uniref:Ltp family lipoprotein n=1 Tax=Staphylococcus agnetis TaxID=985762 RepID=UPI0021CF75A2|nr:Ltp family lipoprotein [Staphylococcus agnetis]UXU59037.1 Ltp family lipoprotein [Staphylococcus agnetis]UXU61363.1 Ltp family lipoprotein [Staphylococcus agnetis]